MPAATAQLPSTMASFAHQQQHQPHPPLRRAVYIHVSDLTSAYNIDHTRLEEELKRVKADRENNEEVQDSKISAAARSSSPNDIEASSTSTGHQKRLQPPRGGFNLCLLVGSVHVVVDKYRVDGSRVRLAEVEIGDETGTVSLRARDEQIDLLQEISDRKGAVVLRNSTLELYQGRHIRLAVTKWGKLSPYPDQVPSTPAPPSRMNDDRYFSLIDLSAVASEMAVFAPNDAYITTSTANSGGTSNENANAAGSRKTGGSQGNRRNNNNRGKYQGAIRQQHQQQQQQQQQPAYTDNRGMLRYPGTLHNYGYAPNPSTPQTQAMFGYHGGRPRPQDAQQFMFQQYEMQHRHQQAQIHYQPPTPDRPPQLGGSMLLPGVSNQQSFDAAFAPAADLQRGGFPSNVYAPPMGAMSAVPPPQPAPQGAAQPRQQHDNLSVPDSPRMNPQAPTFDPTYRKSGRK